MKKWLSARFVDVLFLSLLFSGAAYAQEATERYIPIGESPGVSGVETVIGTITDVDYAERSMEITEDDGSTTVKMTAATLYYLDRSRRGMSNQRAELSDCQVGQTVEVRFRDDGSADWVKIEAR